MKPFWNIIALFKFSKQKKRALLLLWWFIHASLLKNLAQKFNLLLLPWSVICLLSLKVCNQSLTWNSKSLINVRLALATFSECKHFTSISLFKCQWCRQLLENCQQRGWFAMVECHLQLVRILISPSDRFWCLIKAARNPLKKKSSFQIGKRKIRQHIKAVNMTSCNSHFHPSILKNSQCRYLHFPNFSFKGHLYEPWKEPNLIHINAHKRNSLKENPMTATGLQNLIYCFAFHLLPFIPACYGDKHSQMTIAAHGRMKLGKALLLPIFNLIQCRALVLLIKNVQTIQ